MTVRIPLRITEPDGVGRHGDVLRQGVPIPKGVLPRDAQFADGACARLSAETSAGRGVPLQARVLSRWSDGSVRWLLLDLQVDVEAGSSLDVDVVIGAGSGEPSAGSPESSATLRVEDHDGTIRIDAGVARFTLERGSASLISAVDRQGVSWLASPGLATVLETTTAPARAIVDTLQVLERGPVRVVTRADGHFVGAGAPRPLEFQAHLHFTAGSAAVQVDFRIRNPNAAIHAGGLWDLGDARSVLIRELRLQAELAEDVAEWFWAADPAEAPRKQSPQPWALYQDSSGGERWDSPNHLGADGSLTVSFRGFRVSSNAAVVASGERAQPWVAMAGSHTAISAEIRDFWQNFPKALRHDGASRLEVALFPSEGRIPTELQGGEQKRHTIWFDFASPGETAAVRSRRLPLQLTIAPQWLAQSEAIPYLSAPDADDDPEFLEYAHSLFVGPQSMAASREIIDEYGWRNYGDAYADHEAVAHKEPAPFITHYNNQYDVLLATLLHGLRASQPEWLVLGDDLARHISDIDIYHTVDDRPAFNGGLFWHTDHHVQAGLATHRTYSQLNARGKAYGGGPSNEHNYTSGLLLHHFLTGDPDSAEAVRTLSEFVFGIDDGTLTPFGLVDPGPTGGASQTVSIDYHKPGRGAGNSINALLDAYLLTGRRACLRKAEELIERCAHPLDDIDALRLDQPELRWSYLVFLQVLARYLEQKAELGELDFGFAYARATFLHYARWVRERETPYREQLHKVLLPTETWPAHNMRKAHVLAAAARYASSSDERDAFRTDAETYRFRAFRDVNEFTTSRLLRPRIILALYGLAYVWNRRRADAVPKTVEGAHDFGAVQDFVPQRFRWRATLRCRLKVAWDDLAVRLKGSLPLWLTRH